MTIEEALKEIRSNKGWYFETDEKGNLKSHPTLISLAQRIEDGRSKPDTMKKFFDKFGYKMETVINVVKR